MLQEIDNVRRNPGEPPRRWFLDDYFDLLIWIGETDEPIAFQLCYDRNGAPHVLSWDTVAGARHYRVDDGENRPGKPKAAPLLLADGPFPRDRVYRKLREAAARIDPKLAAFVGDAIRSLGTDRDPASGHRRETTSD